MIGIAKLLITPRPRRHARRMCLVLLSSLFALACDPDEEPEIPSVSVLSCRAKDSRMNLVWSAVPEAAAYRVFLGTNGSSELLTETVALVFVERDLPFGITRTYTVRVVNEDGAESADSPPCAVTPLERARDGNDLPLISSQPNLFAVEDVAYEYAVEVTDSDEDDTHSYSLLEAPAGMSIDPTGGLVSWTPAQADVGVHVVTVRVEDSGGLIVSQSYALEVLAVNDPPEIVSEPAPLSLPKNNPFAYAPQVNDPDPETELSFALMESPDGMTIDPDTGAIDWTPSDSQVGTNPVLFEVRDAGGLTDEQSFEVTVTNAAPDIDSAAVTSVLEDSLYSYDVEASDANPEDVLTYALDAAPAGMSIDSASGLIEWLVGNAEVGVHPVLVRVSDPLGLFDTQAFSVTVVNVNDAPFITSLPGITELPKNTLFSYDVDAGDIDLGDTLSFSLEVAPGGMSIDPVSGFLEWTPSNGQVGVNPVRVQVSDLDGAVDQQDFDVTVSNAAPSIDSLPITSTNEDAPYSYDVEASDANPEDVLTYSLDVAPAGMSISSVSGLIQWTPSNDELGSHPVSVRVEDPLGLFDSQSFNLLVNNTNDAPEITSDPVTTLPLPLGEAFYGYEAAANDPDPGDILTFSLDVAPEGMSIDSATGRIEWLANEADAGLNNVTLRVQDLAGASALQPFSIDVVPLRPQITSVPGLQASAQRHYQYDVEAEDPQPEDVLVFSLDVAPAGMNIDPASGLIEWTPSADQLNTHTITVRVQDPAGHFGLQTFTLLVVDDNEPPIITSTPDLEAPHGNFYQYTVVASDANPQDAPSFSLDEAPLGMNINPDTGFLSWTPLALQLGPNSVTVRAEDPLGLATTQSFVIQVIGLAPIITSTPIQTAMAGVRYEYPLQASDANGDDILIYSLDDRPNGMNIDQSTGLIRWTPGSSQVGLNDVTVRVRDLLGLFDLQSFELLVEPAAPPAGASSVEAPQVVAQYFYDAADRLIRIEFPNGVTTYLEYDAVARLVSSHSFSADGLLLAAFEQDLDATGRVLRVSESGDAIGARVIDYAYDASGKRIRRILTSANRNETTQYAYHENTGRLLSSITVITNPGDAPTVNIHSYHYDASSQLLSRSNGTASDRFGYDGDGRLTQIVLEIPERARVDYEYDSDGRLVSWSYQSPERPGEHFYHLDLEGRLRLVTDSDGAAAQTFRDLEALPTLPAGTRR